MRLRQIALVAQDLEVCFRDPGVADCGLHNALMPIGTSFLEVVSPARTGTPASRLLERRRGDGRGEGVGGIDVRGADGRAIPARAAERRLTVHGEGLEICGSRIRLVS